MSARVRVDLGSRGYNVVIGAGAWDELGRVLQGRRRVAIVTQPEVDAVHGAALRTALDGTGLAHQTFLMGDGEEAKTLGTVERLAGGFAAGGVLRGDAVVAFGGGVVGDTAGFVAATYHRGIALVQVPTTLLAMVDAAIGGKTGVNLTEGKNLVGAFHQPLAVLADPSVLATLDEREYRCGLGEIAKYALIDDDFVTARAPALLAREPHIVTDVVARCAAIKARYVEADELERTGTRAVLNYGHTLAHALEVATAHALMHGEAVAIGLVFAAHLATALERIDHRAVDRHERLVASLGLPVTAPPGLHADDVLRLMARDKKAAGGLTFVLSGAAGIERVDNPDPAAVHKALAAVGIDG